VAFEYVKTSVDKKTSFEKLIYAACASSLTIGKIIYRNYNIIIFIVSLFGCSLALDALGRRPIPPNLHATAKHGQ